MELFQIIINTILIVSGMGIMVNGVCLDAQCDIDPKYASSGDIRWAVGMIILTLTLLSIVS